MNNENIPGVEELKVDVNKNKPGAKLIINREKAGELGIATNMVGRQLKGLHFLEQKQAYTKKMERIMK